jgi:PIN domain nuclease of toxin-antitoxin system
VTVVLDASAVLAFLQGEAGADVVEGHLADGAVCGAANWSEVAQKVLAAGRDWDLARALLLSYDVGIEPVTMADAEWAARRWKRGEGLSLADRLCLAVAERAGLEAWTADAAWGAKGSVRQIR